jgi:hypothetical protein
MRDDARIAKLLGQLRDAVAERITELNRSLEAGERTVAAQVGQRKQLASQLQLPERLLKIYNEVKHYPHWVRNCPANVSPLITNVDVVEEGSRDKKVTVRFSLKSRRYSFLFDERYSSEVEGLYAWLTLSGVSGEALFRSYMSKGYWGEYENGDTSAFVPGDWVLDFMELSESVAAIGIERDRTYRLSQIESQKRDFGLGVSESEVQKLQATLGSYGIGEEYRSADTAARAMGRWLRRLFGRRHDDVSKAT